MSDDNDARPSGKDEQVIGWWLEPDEYDHIRVYEDDGDFNFHTTIDQTESLISKLQSRLEKLKSDFQKAKEMRSGAHIRLTCSNCDTEHEAEYARNLAETPQEHADYPDFDCTIDDVKVEAFCPRHGTIPLEYDGCDTCASNSAVMNR